MTGLASPRCPLCSRLPEHVLDEGRQAFCFNEDCKVITWNATLTFDEMMQNVGFLDLSRWAP